MEPNPMETYVVAGLAMARPDVEVERRGDGSRILRSRRPLLSPPQTFGRVAARRGRAGPAAAFLAARAGEAWQRLSWGEGARRAEGLAEALLELGLGSTTPILALSGNSLAQATLMLGAHLGRHSLGAACRRPIRCKAATTASSATPFRSSRAAARLRRAGRALPRRACKALDLAGVQVLTAEKEPPAAAEPRSVPPPCVAAGRAGANVAGPAFAGVKVGPENGRQDPFYLGFDGFTQGGHQHPRHALCEPADDRPGVALPRHESAGPARLVALEPLFRGEPQLQHDPGARRHLVHRRRPAAARPHRGHGAQPARGVADALFQRAGRLPRSSCPGLNATPSCGRRFFGACSWFLRRRGVAAGSVATVRTARRARAGPPGGDGVGLGLDGDFTRRRPRCILRSTARGSSVCRCRVSKSSC